MVKVNGKLLVEALSTNDYHKPIIELIKLIPDWETINASWILRDMPAHTMTAFAAIFGVPELADAKKNYHRMVDQWSDKLQKDCADIIDHSVRGLAWTDALDFDDAMNDLDLRYLYAEARATQDYRKALKRAVIAAADSTLSTAIVDEYIAAANRHYRR